MKSPTTQIIAFLGVIVAILIVGNTIAEHIESENKRESYRRIIAGLDLPSLEEPAKAQRAWIPYQELYYSFGKKAYLRRSNDEPYTGEVRDLIRDGSIHKKGHLRNGMRHGEWTDRNQYDGTVWGKDNFIIVDNKSLSHGEAIGFYEDGSVSSRTRSKFGKLHGLSESFYKNGSKREIRNYHRGKKHGYHEVWFKNGMLDYKMYFVNGEPEDGPFKRYYPNGKVQIDGRFKDGQQIGTWRAYDWSNGKKGELKAEAEFRKNEYVERKFTVFENGKFFVRRTREFVISRGVKEERWIYEDPEYRVDTNDTNLQSKCYKKEFEEQNRRACKVVQKFWNAFVRMIGVYWYNVTYPFARVRGGREAYR